MNRACVFLGLAVLSVSVAHAQAGAADNPASRGPVNMPGWPNAVTGPASNSGRSVEMSQNGQCQAVRPGDTVHFSLRIEGVADARFVFTDLAMGLGSHPRYVKTDFQLPTLESFGGGGAGKRDESDAQLYHFRFVVPKVRSGIYHSAAIGVRASFSSNSADPGIGVDLNKHAHEQVGRYCLAVFGEGGLHRPLVTEFLPGEIEHPSNVPVQPVLR